MTEAPRLEPKKGVISRFFKRGKGGAPDQIISGQPFQRANPDFVPKPPSAKRTNEPLSGVDRSAADALRSAADSFSQPVIDYTSDEGRVQPAASAPRHEGSHTGTIIATVAGAAALAAAGVGAYEVTQGQDSGTDKGAVVNISTPDSTAPTTTDGKQIVVGETPTAKPTEAPTATPTPEKPKTVAWTLDQITAAQQEGLKNNKVLYADTWTEDGGKADDAKNVAGNVSVIVNYEQNPEGKVFRSPIAGTVTSIGVTVAAGDVRTRTIFVQVGGKEIEFITDFSSTINVQRNQKITPGTSLITLTGTPIPSGKFSKPGFVLFADVTNFDSTTENIIKDASGTTVTLK
ncbi:MAG: hypothetical protein ACM3IJ_01770 [Candidatus Levyibacteriota bacterium]